MAIHPIPYFSNKASTDLAVCFPKNLTQGKKVVYISVDENCMGQAIVEGSEPYIVEFDYENGLVSDLTCTCFCNYPCKHQFAAMLQLKETLDLIMKHYKEQYEKNQYFAAISKPVFVIIIYECSLTKDAAQAPCFSYGVKLQGQRVLLSIRLHLRKY